MINMKRFKVIDEDLMRPYEQPHGIVPDEVFVEVVLAADAEAAIAGAFQAGMDQMIGGIEQVSYDKGQRDALKAAVQRVERISKEDGGYCYVLHYCDVIDAINGWQPIEDKITFIRGNDRLKKLREKKS